MASEKVLYKAKDGTLINLSTKVINNTTTNSTTNALSAAQGMELASKLINKLDASPKYLGDFKSPSGTISLDRLSSGVYYIPNDVRHLSFLFNNAYPSMDVSSIPSTRMTRLKCKAKNVPDKSGTNVDVYIYCDTISNNIDGFPYNMCGYFPLCDGGSYVYSLVNDSTNTVKRNSLELTYINLKPVDFKSYCNDYNIDGTATTPINNFCLNNMAALIYVSRVLGDGDLVYYTVIPGGSNMIYYGKLNTRINNSIKWTHISLATN